MRLLLTMAMVAVGIAGPVQAAEITFQGLTGKAMPSVVQSQFKRRQTRKWLPRRPDKDDFVRRQLGLR